MVEGSKIINVCRMILKIVDHEIKKKSAEILPEFSRLCPNITRSLPEYRPNLPELDNWRNHDCANYLIRVNPTSYTGQAKIRL